MFNILGLQRGQEIPALDLYIRLASNPPSVVLLLITIHPHSLTKHHYPEHFLTQLLLSFTLAVLAFATF